jgi:CubicO group peptidase (beta-lactamase class C family)
LIAVATRREVLRALLSVSVGSLLPASKHARNEPKTSGSTSVRPNFESVRSLILQAIEHGKATGVAVAVAHGGRIVWEEGFGWANRAARMKATAHTPFTLPSITKPFTATTLMTLAADSKLFLDDPANKYLMNSGIDGRNGNVDAATVRLLGAHVSGLPTMFEGYDRDEAKLTLSADALIRNYGRLAYAGQRCRFATDGLSPNASEATAISTCLTTETTFASGIPKDWRGGTGSLMAW